jgi:hypothetical protein
MRPLRVIYALAIAGLLIALVIEGVEAFYPPPVPPAFPEHPGYIHSSPEWEEWYRSPEWEEWQREVTRINEEYWQAIARHYRNTFLIVLPLGMLFAIAGTFIQRKVVIFGAGLILAGMGTMIFAVTPRGLDDRLQFVGIAVALAVAIFVGYKVFFSSRKD